MIFFCLTHTSSVKMNPSTEVLENLLRSYTRRRDLLQIQLCEAKSLLRERKEKFFGPITDIKNFAVAASNNQRANSCARVMYKVAMLRNFLDAKSKEDIGKLEFKIESLQTWIENLERKIGSIGSNLSKLREHDLGILDDGFGLVRRGRAW